MVRGVPGTAQSIRLENDSQCRLVVVEKRATPFIVPPLHLNPAPEEAANRVRPQNASLKLQPAAFGVKGPITQYLRLAKISSSNNAVGRFRPVTLQGGSSSVFQEVWMYGYGGENDRLTQKEGRLNFTWNGSTVTATYHNGWCPVPGSWNGWELYGAGCEQGDYGEGPSGTLVYRQGIGYYIWDPWYAPPDFYHSLFDHEEAAPDGSVLCAFTDVGEIVMGVTNNCSQP